MASAAPPIVLPSKGQSVTIGGAALTAAAMCLVALQIELLFAKSINWDEFFHFSQIHAHLRGEDVQWLQTPHIRLFGWVPSLPGSPIDHIMLIRVMLMPLGIITSLMIYDITRRFSDRQSAALAALAFAGGGYVFAHSFALRADMIAAALLTATLWVMATRPKRILWSLVTVALCGLAFLATIKSVLYAPALMAMAAWRWRDLLAGYRLSLGWISLACGTITISAATIYFLMPPEISHAVMGLFKSSWNRMFSAGLFPQGRYLIVQLITAPILTGAIIFAVISSTKGDRRMPSWLIAGLMLPLASVLIYRNAYPYFFPFILPPVAIAAALGVEAITKRYGAKLVLGTIVAAALVQSITEPREMLGKQRAVHDGISQIFSEPVRYIDDIAFRPDFPRAVPQFASGWALENYRNAGTPRYSQAMQAQPTPFLFRQGYALEVMEPEANDQEALLPADASALNSNYIEHWGRVYVAGKTIPASDETQSITIRIPGIYTVEGTGLLIDGKLFEVGSIVNLAIGRVSLKTTGGEDAVLRWGDHLALPEAPFPFGPLFSNY